jgi:lipid A 3-O-deacylase
VFQTKDNARKYIDELPKQIKFEKPYITEIKFDLSKKNSKIIYKKEINLNDYYTIVLCNTQNIENAKSFIDNTLNKKDHVKIIKNNQSTYLTTYGRFSKRSEALNAFVNLSTEIKELKPYIIKVPNNTNISNVQENKRITKTYHIDNNSIFITNNTKNEHSNNIKKTEHIDQLKEEKNIINSISLGIGANKDNKTVYRVAVQKDFGSLFGNKDFNLDLDVALTQFSCNDAKVHIFALSPLFSYKFNNTFKTVKPYIKGGIGLSYIDTTFLEDRGFSTHFQFEDRIALGFFNDYFDLSLNYIHYSNASIKKPNDGLDTLMLSLEVPIR